MWHNLYRICDIGFLGYVTSLIQDMIHNFNRICDITFFLLTTVYVTCMWVYGCVLCVGSYGRRASSAPTSRWINRPWAWSWTSYSKLGFLITSLGMRLGCSDWEFLQKRCLISWFFIKRKFYKDVFENKEVRENKKFNIYDTE